MEKKEYTYICVYNISAVQDVHLFLQVHFTWFIKRLADTALWIVC